MAVRLTNPITALGNMLAKSIEKSLQPGSTLPQPVPAPSNPSGDVPASPPAVTPKDGEVTTGQWIDAAAIPVTISQAQTEEFRRVVDSFDEDKQERLAWAISKVYTFLAYLLPPLTAWYVGMAIGDAFSGKFTFADAWSVYAHLISISLEMMLPVLGLAVTVTFKRALKDRQQVYLCVVLIVLFLALGIGNSFAQIFLIDQHVKVLDTAGLIAIWFRALAPLIIDIIATIYLAVVGVRNLKKYLADQREKIAAVRDVNAVNIEMEQTQIKAAIDKQSALMDMQSKAQRASTWNEIERMQSQAMIEQARKNMLDSGDNGGSYRRGRY